MKKVLAILMIVLLTTGTVFAGYEMHEDSDYLLNTNARMLKGYSEGEDPDDEDEIEYVDQKVQLKYSKGLDVGADDEEDLPLHTLPDVDELLMLMVESDDDEEYGDLEDAITNLFGTDDQGYVVLQRHYYTTSGAISTTTPGAVAISYPMEEPPVDPDVDEPVVDEVYGPYKHVVSYKIVLVEEEIDEPLDIQPEVTTEMNWRVMEVTHERYGHLYYEMGDSEYGWMMEKIIMFSYKNDEITPPSGLGKYKKDNEPKVASTPEDNNGKKDDPPGNAYGRTKVKPVNYGQSKKTETIAQPGSNGKAKGKNK